MWTKNKKTNRVFHEKCTEFRQNSVNNRGKQFREKKTTLQNQHFGCIEGLNRTKSASVCFKWPLKQEDNTSYLPSNSTVEYCVKFSSFKCKYHPMDVPFSFPFRKWSTFIDRFVLLFFFCICILLLFCKHLSATISPLWIQNIKNVFVTFFHSINWYTRVCVSIPGETIWTRCVSIGFDMSQWFMAIYLNEQWCQALSAHKTNQPTSQHGIPGLCCRILFMLKMRWVMSLFS